MSNGKPARFWIAAVLFWCIAPFIFLSLASILWEIPANLLQVLLGSIGGDIPPVVGVGLTIALILAGVCAFWTAGLLCWRAWKSVKTQFL